jgi:hypothetical protein
LPRQQKSSFLGFAARVYLYGGGGRSAFSALSAILINLELELDGFFAQPYTPTSWNIALRPTANKVKVGIFIVAFRGFIIRAAFTSTMRISWDATVQQTYRAFSRLRFFWKVRIYLYKMKRLS